MIKQIQHAYSDYSFIEEANEVQRRSRVVEDEGEADDYMELYNLFHSIISRTYEEPYQYYFVIFKPYDDPYNRDPSWFKYKGIDKCRQLFKTPQYLLLTREVDAKKIHVNALVCTDQDLMKRHNTSYCKRYKLTVIHSPTILSRENRATYMLKEHKIRPFTKYIDFYHYIRK